MEVERMAQSLLVKLDKLKTLATPEAIKFAEKYIENDNKKIKDEIECIKSAVLEAELLLGVRQIKIPQPTFIKQSVKEAPVNVTESAPVQPTMEPNKSKKNAPAGHSSVKAPLTERSSLNKSETSVRKDNKKSDKPATEGEVDVGRLDMRVGRIIEVSRHPDADTLYVEKVDLGNNEVRTVVSGLVKYVNIDHLENLIGIFLCNLKPAKMRGVESQAMLMCASAPEAGVVEPLTVDGKDVQLGDTVVVPGYGLNPDAQLNPKKKIFEQIKPDLRVNTDGFAAYKNTAWTLKNCPGAVIRAKTLKDVQIA